MRRFALLLLVIALVGAMVPSSAFACYPGKVTFGGWQHRIIPDGGVGQDGATWSYSGVVIGDGTGAAKGTIEMQRDTVVDYKAHCDALYIIIEPDKTAWVGAVVLTSTDPLFPPGTEFVLELKDWGEGANAPDDQTSDIWRTAASDAWSMAPLFMYGWSGGNVQLHIAKK